MFRALPAGSQIEATPNRIVSLHRCLNSSPIALGGGPAVQSRANIVGVYNNDGSYTVYLVLAPVAGGAGVLFCCDPRTVSLAEYRAVEREAVELVEGQGFVMEPVELKHISASEVDAALADLPIVRPDFSNASGNYGRTDSGAGLPQPQGLPRTRTGAYPPATAAARSSQSRSGLYALPGQGRQQTYSSRITSGATTPAVPAGVPRTPTASFGRPIVQSGPAPAPQRASTSSGGVARIPTGNVSSLGRQPVAPPPAARHAQGPSYSTSPGSPAGSALDEIGLAPEETIALLGRLLALF